MSSKTWLAYYQKLDGRRPRPLFSDALKRFGATTGFAIDLGCGDGTETYVLIENGWQVLAIDQEPAAIQYVTNKISNNDRLQTQVVSFMEMQLPLADFIYAGYSLPFCAPATFDMVWSKVKAAIRVNGRFAGQFFGDRDAWVGNPKLTFHTIAQTKAYLDGFDIEYFEEFDKEAPSAKGPKHWHLFNVIAQRR